MPAKEEYWSDPEKFRMQANEWRLAHPEEHRKANREWIAKKRAADPEANREKSRRARAAWTPEQHERQKERQRDWMRANPGYSTRWNRENPDRYLLRQAKNRAKRLGLPFNLTLADVAVPEICPVLGVKLAFIPGAKMRQATTSPSLDRLIPALGYVKGNVRVISNRANLLKCDATLAELEALVAYMRRELG